MQFEPWPESETICFTDKDNVYSIPAWKMSGKDIPYIGWSIRGGTLETQLNFQIVESGSDPVRSRELPLLITHVINILSQYKLLIVHNRLAYKVTMAMSLVTFTVAATYFYVR